MARATSGLAYPKRFYAGFDGGSSTSSVTSKFPNDVALLLYTLYQQWFPMSYSDRSWSYGWLATTMVAAATVGLVVCHFIYLLDWFPLYHIPQGILCVSSVAYYYIPLIKRVKWNNCLQEIRMRKLRRE